MNYTDEELIAMWNARNARVNKRNARKASSTEHDLQVACVNEFRYLNPRFADLLIAIPNGGKRNAIVAAKMKAEGVVAGVPDLFFAHPSGEWHGLFLEMKNGKAHGYGKMRWKEGGEWEGTWFEDCETDGRGANGIGKMAQGLRQGCRKGRLPRRKYP